MIEVRGSVIFPSDALPGVDGLLSRHQWAIPKSSGHKAPEGFPVYREFVDGRILIPRYSPLINELLKLDLEIVKSEPGDIGGDHYEWNPDRPLREKQKPGAEKAEAVLRDERGMLLIGDTGSGKTVMGMWLMNALQGRRTLILVDQLDIAKQWAERLREFVPNVEPNFLLPGAEARKIMRHVDRKLGPAKGNVNDYSVTIGTVQSLHASSTYTIRNTFDCELLLCDEVHVFGAPTFMGALFKVNYGYAVGLTATDDRKDELDWIFRQCLGKARVEFEGEVMDPIVHRLVSPSCGFKEHEWRTQRCREKRGKLTWLDACRDCAYFDAFPENCGGQLKVSRTGKPKWGTLNRAGLLSAWSNHPQYRAWCMTVIDQVVKKKRSIFVFGEGRRFLTSLYEASVEVYGEQNVGLFLGKKSGSDQVGAEYEYQRNSALEKPLTFVTYGVARKALDVKQKDCAFFATPISDARQAAGRVRRAKKGKAQPLVLVSVPPNLTTFVRSWIKVKAQFKEKGWEIIEE